MKLCTRREIRWLRLRFARDWRKLAIVPVTTAAWIAAVSLALPADGDLTGVETAFLVASFAAVFLGNLITANWPKKKAAEGEGRP